MYYGRSKVSPQVLILIWLAPFIKRTFCGTNIACSEHPWLSTKTGWEPLTGPFDARFSILSCVATSVLRMRLLHAVAFSKKLRWLTQTKVITLKTQLQAVNACVKRSSQRSFNQRLTCRSHRGTSTWRLALRDPGLRVCKSRQRRKRSPDKMCTWFCRRLA